MTVSGSNPAAEGSPPASETPPYTLGALYLNISDRCNLRCRHCWLSPETVPGPGGAAESTEGGQGIVSLAVMKEVIRQAVPLGLHSVKLTGGEPFLRRDLLEFISFFHDRGLIVDVETNGTLIDDADARRLRECGVRTVSVSLDGPDEASHDAFRGMKGAFAAALRGIGHLRRHRVDTQVIMSLYRDNMAGLERVAFLAEARGASSFKVNPVLPMGRGLRMKQARLTLPVEELIALSRRIREDLRPRLGIPVYFSLPVAFEPFREIVSGTHAECPILNILGIAENGDVSFCGIGAVEKDLVMGNILRDRLDTIWRTHPLLKALRESVPRDLEGICGKCFFKKICLGSCRACAYHLEGRLTAPYWFCQEAYEKGLFPKTRYVDDIP